MNYESPAAVEAMIAALRAKLRAVPDEKSKEYYRKCITGWEEWLRGLKAKQ